jgi:hypothetical protein
VIVSLDGGLTRSRVLRKTASIFALTSLTASLVNLESFWTWFRTLHLWTVGARRHTVLEVLKIVPIVPAPSKAERYAQSQTLVVAKPGECTPTRTNGDRFITGYIAFTCLASILIILEAGHTVVSAENLRTLRTTAVFTRLLCEVVVFVASTSTVEEWPAGPVLRVEVVAHSVVTTRSYLHGLSADFLLLQTFTY